MVGEADCDVTFDGSIVGHCGAGWTPFSVWAALHLRIEMEPTHRRGLGEDPRRPSIYK